MSKMQLPKYHKTYHIKSGICIYPGCGKEYSGHPRRRYCDFHTDYKHRKRIKPFKPPNTNLIIKHRFNATQNIILSCEACGREYPVKLYPKVFIYPRFCEIHRNSYHRNPYSSRKTNETNYIQQ
jgi:hypothetical protein